MENRIPVHRLKPNEAMKANGFSQEIESCYLQQMTCGRLAVFPVSVMRKESPPPYKVFKDYDELMQNFEVVDSPNPMLNPVKIVE